MNMIANIFLTILGMSLTAAYCILAVCLLRVLLRRMPKIFSYCLWSVVALRLVCPILPESRFSLMGDRVVESARQLASTNREYESIRGMNPMADGLGGNIVPNASEILGLPETEGIGESGSGSVNTINDNPSGEVEGDITPANGKGTSVINANVNNVDINNAGVINPGEIITSDNPIESGNIIYFAAAIWLGIFLLLCAYGIGSYLRLKMQLAKVAYTGMPFENIPVKYAPGIETPFVLGLVHPIVYLPVMLTDSEAMQCLSHERVHVQRRDYLVKQFAFVLACVHWFNPFVWLAFHLMSQDMEMSCDEQALQSPALADRKAYSDTLLKVSTGRVQFGGCPLAFGENSTSLRIKNIMNYKKPGFWVMVVVCVAMITCMVGLFTNPVNGTADETEADIDAEIEAKIDQDLVTAQGEPTDEAQNIGPVQAQYEAELVNIMKNNLENNYLKQIGIREASIHTLEDVQTENKEKLENLQNNLNASAGAEAKNAEKILELQTKIAELNKNAEWDAFFMKESLAEKAALELRLQKMDITDMDGKDVNLTYSADKYLNQPEINCFLMQNFNTSQIDLDFLFYDGAGLENSEPSAEERQLLEGAQEENTEQEEIFYHFTGEQIDSFLTEKLGLPLSEIQYGTGSGNTLKDTWEYLEEYDSYTLFAPKGDTFYTKVECVYAFNYYNGILRLDYKKAGKTWSSDPLIKGSLYLAPKDAKNGDVNHLNSYYIIGNEIREGSFKDRDPENAFDLSEYLNRLKQS